MAARARTSSSVADAAAGDHRDVGGGDRGGEPVDVGAAEQPVALDVGDHERRRRREAAERVGELHAARLGPAVHGDVAAAVVEPDGHGHDGGDVVDERRVAHRGRAHHDAGDAGVGERPGVVDRAHAAAGLHGRPPGDRGDDRRHDAAVRRLTRARRVEVDDVDPRRALLGEVRGDGDGVVAVHGLGRVVALAQPHDVAAAQVDRGIETHRTSAGLRAGTQCVTCGPSAS